MIYNQDIRHANPFGGRVKSAWRPGPLVVVLLAAAGAHALTFAPSEPFYNNDETRHVMTGVYFRDLYLAHPAPGELCDWTVRYYLQYPALGLLIFPPAFHAIEGVAFLTLGTSFLVARLLVAAFALVALSYLYLLVRRTHDARTATIATLFLAFSPLVFLFSTRVMLEVPALAWSLMAAFHFHRYLDGERRLDLVLCCLATTMTALTRYDGVFLAPLFLIWLIAARRLRLLLRPAVLAGVAGALLMVVPFYALAAREYGPSMLLAASQGTNPEATGFLHPHNFVFYPACVPSQIGWAALPALLLGVCTLRRAEGRAAAWPYLAMILAVYVTFTPMAELEERHAIYWVPALSVFVAVGLGSVAPDTWRVTCILAGVALAGVAVQSWLTARSEHVYGYEEAARYVAENNDETPVCLFDGFLGGDFIYQLRRRDPERRLWVLRGDKVFYGSLSDPHTAYEQYAHTEQEILDLIYRFDPTLIVVEQPYAHELSPEGARLLRRTLANPDNPFRREGVVPITSDHPYFTGRELHVYRNLRRNPNREEVEFRVKSLGRKLGAPINSEP
jgi:hypothetical protein